MPALHVKEMPEVAQPHRDFVLKYTLLVALLQFSCFGSDLCGQSPLML